jgi:hypothetical protein
MTSQQKRGGIKPLVIVGIVVVGLALFVVALGAGIMATFRRSDAYTGAVARAVADSAVAARLGAPITTGYFTTGSISLNNNDGVAEISIPLHGAREDGTLLVEANKKQGVWTYARLEVQTASDGKSINLIRPDSTATKPPA